MASDDSANNQNAEKNQNTNTSRSGTQTALTALIVVLVIGLIAGVVIVVLYMARPDKETPVSEKQPCELGFTHVKCTPADMHKFCTDNNNDENIQARCKQHCRQAPMLHNYCEYEAACRDLEYPTPAESVALFAGCETCLPYADKLQFCTPAQFDEVCTIDLCADYCSTIEASDPRFATCAAVCPAIGSDNCFEYCLTIEASDPRSAKCVEYCKHAPDSCMASCNKKGYPPLSPHLNSVCKILGPALLLENALVNILAWVEFAPKFIIPLLSRDCRIDINEDDMYSGDLPEVPCFGVPVIYSEPEHIWRTADVEYEQFIAPDGIEYDTWLCVVAATNNTCVSAPFLSLGPDNEAGWKPIVFVPESEKIKFRLVSVGDCRYIWTNKELTHYWYLDNGAHLTPISAGNDPSHPNWQAKWNYVLKIAEFLSLVLVFVE